MSEPEGYHAEWNKPVTEQKNKYCMSPCIWGI
jgi:hypothetical protein